MGGTGVGGRVGGGTSPMHTRSGRVLEYKDQ
jgi:hypothetical protein